MCDPPFEPKPMSNESRKSLLFLLHMLYGYINFLIAAMSPIIFQSIYKSTKYEFGDGFPWFLSCLAFTGLHIAVGVWNCCRAYDVKDGK